MVTSGTLGVTLPTGSPWNKLGSPSTPSRWETRIHNFGSKPWNFSIVIGPVKVFVLNDNQVYFAETHNPPAGDSSPGFAAGPPILNSRQTDIVIRLQRDVARRQYTLEMCDTIGGNCTTAIAPVGSFGQTSYGGFPISIGSGYQMAFLRWYSTVVPLGTPVAISGAGDLADWEFEGNLNDSSGHGLTLTGGSVSYSATPVFAPSCDAGFQQILTAGLGTVQLDGSGSQPLDGGDTLSYNWTQTTAQILTLNSTAISRPSFSASLLVFGPVNFSLTVTDGSAQSSTCAMHDGAITIDSNSVVVTENANVDELIGKQIAFGKNPWPWFDKQNKELADLQIGAMDTNFPDYWDTPATGKVSVNPRQTCSGSAAGACLIGVGTSFTTDLSAGAYIVLWWNGGTDRRLNVVKSVVDDTHLILAIPWDAGLAGDRNPTVEESLTYSAPSTTDIGNWGYAQVTTPGNYYDNVEAYYALYYRTGIDTYLNAAHTLADRFWASPMIDKGNAYVSAYNVGSSFAFAVRSESLTGLVLRAFEQAGTPADMWAGLRNMWGRNMYNLNNFDPHYWGTDQRDMAFDLLYVSYCALFDPDPSEQFTCKTSLSNSFASPGNQYAVWQPERAPDNSFPTLEYTIPDLVHDVTLTQGSTAVTGSGTTWTTGQFKDNPLVFFSNFPKMPNIDNSDFYPVFYHPTVVSPTQLILDQPFGGPGGTYGWSIGAGGSGLMGWGGQPFMEGIQIVAFEMAGTALAASDPASSSLAYTYSTGLAYWLKTYGYSDPTVGGVGGLYYNSTFLNCAYPVQTARCTNGFSSSQARTDAAEAVRGISMVYARTVDPVLKTFVDLLYSQMFSKPGSSLQFPGDGEYINDLDDGQTFMSNGVLANKWLGFFFGFDNGASWPAVRLPDPRIYLHPSER